MATIATGRPLALTQTGDESTRWLRFLSRWALATVIMGVALLVVYIGGIGFAPSDNALGAKYSELLQAVRAPVMYRLAMVFDALGWLMMGGALVILAAILQRQAPIRSLLIAACGVGLIVGVLGGVMRLVGNSDLAAQYASSAPAQQTALLGPTLALYETVSALFVVGDFLGGAGWLLVASAGFALAAFPRWLAVWFTVAGALSMLQGVTSALDMFSFPVLLLTIILGVLGVHAAMAVAFWRPSSVLVAGVVGGGEPATS